MKLKKMVGMVVAFATFTVAMLMPAFVQASSIVERVTSEETTEDQAEDTRYSLFRGSNLNSGTVKIAKLSDHEIAIYGLTQGHHVCDKLFLSLYLEQKSDGSYGTYDSWHFTATDVTSLERTITVLVPSGHYYRVRGYHAAADLDAHTKESISTLTQGIWVGSGSPPQE